MFFSLVSFLSPNNLFLQRGRIKIPWAAGSPQALDLLVGASWLHSSLRLLTSDFSCICWLCWKTTEFSCWLNRRQFWNYKIKWRRVVSPPPTDDFESKYSFHPLDDFPPPDEYRHFAKIYPSKANRGTHTVPVLQCLSEHIYRSVNIQTHCFHQSSDRCINHLFVYRHHNNTACAKKH